VSKRALRLLPGGAEPAPRSVRRRAATRRRTTVRRDPIVELLEHLDEEPAGDPPAAAAPSRRRTVLLAAALCAALAVAAIFGYRWYDDRALDSAHQRAVAAARQATVDFVSVSAATVDRDLQRIVSGATGDFHDEFTRGQAQVRAAVVENNVDSRGTVLRAALVSGDRSTAVVLVAIDATVRNAKAPEGRASHYRIQLDMARDPGSGRWLVNKLQFVG
jgi:Mce-associated membrane protein